VFAGTDYLYFILLEFAIGEISLLLRYS